MKLRKNKSLCCDVCGGKKYYFADIRINVCDYEGVWEEPVFICEDCSKKILKLFKGIDNG